MNEDWRKDPKLAKMSPEKLEFLNTYAERLSGTPKDRMMNTFLSIQNEAMQKKIRFDEDETELMMQILGSNMTPEEKKRMETFTTLAKKLAVRK